VFARSREESEVNTRGRGQTSHMLLGEGDFGSRNLCVTWVDCEPGSQQGLHAHEHGEQVYVIVSGTGTMLVGDEEREVGPGTMVFIPPRTRHAIRASADAPLTYVSATSPPFPADRDGSTWTPLET
jgi:mannose-6-phosphate isomerase-like protein (cupin superfamily)